MVNLDKWIKLIKFPLVTSAIFCLNEGDKEA